jgi:hydrogenase-4 component B
MTLPVITGVAGSAFLLVGVVVAAFVRTRRLGLALQACGLAAFGAIGCAVLSGADSVGADFHDTLNVSVGLDPLSGCFVAATALVAIPSTIFAMGYLTNDRRGATLSALTGLFMASLLMVVVARDPLTFLAGWELMTVVPAATILIDAGRQSSARRAAFAYLAMTHIAGAGVWLAILTLADAHALSGAGQIARSLELPVLVATLVGFGAKAGLMPLHSWLPRAHPAAPSHVSAAMSGMMVKVALYGLIRVVFEWAAPVPEWVGLAMLAVGALSAVGGIVYALMQQDLKRLLAFSSIENVGIVVLALGASLAFAHAGNDTWAGIAFVAALFHIVNHALFKAVLFLGAGTFQHALGHLDTSKMGGMLARMPRSGVAFLIAALAICGVPPLNGFASEWMALQSLLHLATTTTTPIALVAATTAAALAATAALAVLCFVKVVGLVLLGPARTARGNDAREAPRSMTVPMLALSGGCIAFGLFPGLVVRRLAAASPFPIPTHATYGIGLNSTGQYPAVAIAATLLVLAGGLAHLRSRSTVSTGPIWVSGQLVKPQLRWTSAGFTKALRLILEVALRPERAITTSTEHGVVQSVTYRGEVPHLFDTHFLDPLVRLSTAGGRHVKRLQSGSLAGYIGYLVGALVAALVVARLLGTP